MHDLNTISKRNAEAFADAVENFRRQGRFVIANYSGITLCSIETFGDEGDAMRAFTDFQPKDPSNTVRLLFPHATRAFTDFQPKDPSNTVRLLFPRKPGDNAEPATAVGPADC